MFRDRGFRSEEDEEEVSAPFVKYIGDLTEVDLIRFAASTGGKIHRSWGKGQIAYPGRNYEIELADEPSNRPLAIRYNNAFLPLHNAAVIIATGRATFMQLSSSDPNKPGITVTTITFTPDYMEPPYETYWEKRFDMDPETKRAIEAIEQHSDSSPNMLG